MTFLDIVTYRYYIYSFYTPWHPLINANVSSKIYVAHSRLCFWPSQMWKGRKPFSASNSLSCQLPLRLARPLLSLWRFPAIGMEVEWAQLSMCDPRGEKAKGQGPLGWSIMCWLSWVSGPGCWWRPTSRASSRSLELCPWPSICFHGPSCKFLDPLPLTSLPPVQKRDAQHMFLQHKRARTERGRGGSIATCAYASKFHPALVFGFPGPSWHFCQNSTKSLGRKFHSGKTFQNRRKREFCRPSNNIFSKP